LPVLIRAATGPGARAAISASWRASCFGVRVLDIHTKTD
jgi:hypothetical protein